jgi:hypothetical protein
LEWWNGRHKGLIGFRMKVYGPYTRKDGRQFVLVYEGKIRKTVSYPKYLVESIFNIKLKDNETIDHIDGKFINNDFSNIRVVNRSEHSSDDILRRKNIIEKCVLCGKVFSFDPRRTRKIKGGKAGPFCSRRCSGIYGSLIQNNRIEKLPPYLPKIEYYKLKHSKHIEPIIGNNNSGHGDIGELLTGNADDNTEGTVKTELRRD